MSRLADRSYLALKAGAASAVSLSLSHLLHVDDGLSAGFVAIACVSPSAFGGVRRGLEQVLGSLLGCLFAGAPLLARPELRGSAWALVPGLAMSVYASLRLGLGTAYLVAGFTALYLHLLPFTSPLAGVTDRLSAVLIGVAAATAINVAVSAVDAENIVRRRVERATSEVASVLEGLSAWLEGGARPSFDAGFAAITALRDDLSAEARELLFPGAARARESGARGLAAAQALERALHLARELSLVIDDAELHQGSRAALSPALRAFAAALSPGGPRAGAAVDEALVYLDAHDGALVASVLHRLARAIDGARELEGGPPTAPFGRTSP